MSILIILLIILIILYIKYLPWVDITDDIIIWYWKDNKRDYFNLSKWFKEL
jgi:hypothetical protein